MSEKIKGFAALTKGATLTPFTYDPPTLKENELRIDISHCGICGSDIHAIDDDYSVFDFPFIPGHEVVGVISEVGSGIPASRIGERVGVGWQARACGHCEWCLKGEVQLCLDVGNNGTWTPYGGFSTSIVVQDEFAYPLPEDLPSEHAAVLLCAGLTVFTALSRYYSPAAQKIGIVGIGGLGHLALQFASALGYEVTAISSSSKKREEAFGFGASHYIDSSAKGAYKPFNGYFDMVLITSQGSIDWSKIQTILKRRGKIIMVAFPQVDLDPVDLVVYELSILGSFVGTPDDMRKMLAFAAEHKIRPMVEIIPMSRINEAIARIRQNKAHYRIVLVNDIN
jgi:uncharacterized zinc-type alcohol dehydrogenase-like protein